MFQPPRCRRRPVPRFRCLSCGRTFSRQTFNRDRESPAQLLGFMPRPLRWGELLGWRPDWREQSPHPLWRGTGRSGAGSAAA